MNATGQFNISQKTTEELIKLTESARQSMDLGKEEMNWGEIAIGLIDKDSNPDHPEIAFWHFGLASEKFSDAMSRLLKTRDLDLSEKQRVFSEQKIGECQKFILICISEREKLANIMKKNKNL